MKVLVYVEGPSDRDALAKLLRPLIGAGRANGVGVAFLPQGSKDALLDEVPRKAADYLAEKPDDWVFVLPDLYPMARYRGTKNQHESFAEFEKLVRARFDSRAAKVNVSQAAQARFRVHCLKHDLEARPRSMPRSVHLRALHNASSDSLLGHRPDRRGVVRCLPLTPAPLTERNGGRRPAEMSEYPYYEFQAIDP